MIPPRLGYGACVLGWRDKVLDSEKDRKSIRCLRFLLASEDRFCQFFHHEFRGPFSVANANGLSISLVLVVLSPAMNQPDSAPA